MSVSVVCPYCAAVNDRSETERGSVACTACGRQFTVETRIAARPPRARVVKAAPVDDIPVADLDEPPPDDVPVADLEEPVEAVPDIPLAEVEEVPDIALEVVAPARSRPVAAPVSRSTPERPVQPQPPGLPFKLKPDERILLRAGFGSVGGWVWVCTMLPMSLGCFSLLAILQSLASLMKGQYLGLIFWLFFLPVVLVVGLWPLLRTGRYWLTTHRLLWKPRLGGLKEMRLVDVDTDDISGDKLKSKLTVYGDDRKITLRYVAGMDRLWGGILTLANMDEDDLVPSGKGVAEVAWWPGGRSQGMRQQPGLLVLRPEYVAFLPSGESKHLGVEFFKQSVGKAVMEAMGKKEKFPLEASMPFDVLVGLMSERSPEQFDEFMQDAVDQYDGVLWWRDDAEVFREAVPLRPSRTAVAFRSDGVKISGLAARDQDDTIDRILGHWTGGEPVQRRYPFARVAIAGAVSTALAAFLIYQGNSYDEPIVEVGNVTLTQALDKSAAPEKSFVTVSGHIDAVHITHLKPDRKNGTGHVLVAFQESPRLILYLSEDHELSQAIKKRDAATGKKATATATEELAREWTLSGRIYSDGADGRPHTKIPVAQVREFATREQGVSDAKTTRVLMVGMSPQDQVWTQRMPYGLACFFGLLASLCGLATIRALIGRLRA